MNKLEEFILKLNYMEFGYLYAAISPDEWDKMPRSLWLKLHIHATKAYLKHPSLGKKAKEDIKRYEKELKELYQ